MTDDLWAWAADLTVEVAITAGCIFLLLLLSAFLSGAETALTAASRARIHQLARAGNARARSVEDLRDNPGALIGAILFVGGSVPTRTSTI